MITYPVIGKRGRIKKGETGEGNERLTNLAKIDQSRDILYHLCADTRRLNEEIVSLALCHERFGYRVIGAMT